MSEISLYLLSALIACAVTAGSMPLLHHFLAKYFLDVPSGIKKHKHAVPVLGGSAIFLGLSASLIFMRLATHFPTGTLHSLRGVLIGAGIIFLLGLADDLKKPKGLSAPVKLAVQALAAAVLILYGVRITLFNCPQLSYPLTFLWVIGITNAFNLLDIADGLCISQAVICATGLLFITLPTEFTYANFCACAVLGASIGFWPYNHQSKFKTFLGDSGSTLLGFLLAALACGSGYSENSNLGFLAPLLILAVPLFDTAFVALIRILQGKNPLQGSNDHAALRLQKAGVSRYHTLLLFIGAGLFFNILGFAVTQTDECSAAALYFLAFVLLTAAGIFLGQIRMKS